MFNNKNGKLYRNEVNKRIYLGFVSLIGMVVSELTLYLSNHIDIGYRIYYLKCKSKHSFSLNSEKLNYLFTEDVRNGERLFYFFSDNIKKIKLFQKLDLFYLTSLKELGLLILISKLDENDKYYFNLILGFKNNFDIKLFNNNVLNSAKLYFVVELNDFNLS